MHKKSKFLVRNLSMINEKGEEQILSLSYVEVEEENGEIKNIRVFPFDKERAGYAYLERLSIDLRKGHI